MNTPLATVIVPVKNMSGRLKNISSWLQEIEDLSFEIIFVDDNSTDSTLKELVGLKTRFNSLSIQVISGEFFGPGGARNAGLSLAQGKWVIFWDSDDTPHPKAFFEMIISAIERDLDFAAGKWVECRNANSEEATVRERSKNLKLREFIEYPGIWRWAFERSAIGNIRFPNLSLGEDLIFLSKLQIRFSRVYRHPEIVYSYCTGSELQLTSKNSIRRNSAGLLQYLRSKEFFSGKITFFGVLLRTKLLFSTFKGLFTS